MVLFASEAKTPTRCRCSYTHRCTVMGAKLDDGKIVVTKLIAIKLYDGNRRHGFDLYDGHHRHEVAFHDGNHRHDVVIRRSTS